jgi:hypothetical protein
LLKPGAQVRELNKQYSAPAGTMHAGLSFIIPVISPQLPFSASLVDKLHWNGITNLQRRLKLFS